MLYWYLLVVFIIFVWIVIMMALYYSRWKEPLEKKGFSLAGPFILWKTIKGRRFIERIAKRKRLMTFYGKVSVWVTGVAMFTMTFFLFWAAILAVERMKYLDLEPHMLLGLPGLNPLIPLWYGIFALAVAMIVHEFSHGIMSVLAKVKIKSLGLLFFIFPMGAFVEPDEDELKEVEKKKRVRMFASGPAANIMVAAICSVIFSVVLLGSVQPITDGAGITTVGDGSAADIAGLEEGMVMVSFDAVEVNSYADFSYAVRQTEANQTVTIGVYDADLPGEIRYLTATLTDKALSPKGKPEDAGKGYLGVSTMTVSTAHFHPISGADELGGYTRSISMYVVLPLQGLSPVQGSTMDFYEVTGVWSNRPKPVF
jgi:membrane-associated protease RseP (regulator of RpoE activity)